MTMRKILKVSVACTALAGMVFGATQAGGAPSSPTESEASQANAPNPFNDYTQPAGADLSDDAVKSIALEQAAIAGDAEPTSITATSSSYAAAVHALDPGASMPASESAGEESYRRSSVQVLVMNGDFKLSNSRVPKGRTEPSGPVLFLVIDAHTGKIEVRGVEENNPAGVAELGDTRSIR
jgi:hypothetical protein